MSFGALQRRRAHARLRLLRMVCLLVIVGGALVSGAGAAGPPGNDNQVNAAVLSPPAAVDGTTVGATAAAGDPVCGAPMTATVWYELSRPDDLTVVVNFQANGELDAVVGAFQVVRTGLKALVCVVSDSHGKAGFSFAGEKDATYLIVVGQRSNSVAGTFHMTVQAPPRPPNDDPAAAQQLTRLPAYPKGTTLGGSIDAQTPHCQILAADVWYRVDRKAAGTMVVQLRAGGDLDGTLAIYRQVRSQLQEVSCLRTDAKGRADVSFETAKGDRYLIAVGQLLQSSPGPFTLKVFAPDRPAVGPGAALAHGRAAASVDALTNRDNAYAVPMKEGRTYRLNLVGRTSCVAMALYEPGTKLFADAEPIRYARCGGYLTFTPGPDRSGVYSVRVMPSNDVQGAQRYVLLAAPVGADDVGPGLELRSGDFRRGGLDGAGIDVVDLYRFDVPRVSDVDLRVTLPERGGVSATVLSESGVRIGTRQIRDRLRVRLQPGRYFVTLRATQPLRAHYRIGLQIRDITATTVAVDGAQTTTIEKARPVSLTATVTPSSASGGIVRITVGYLDPLQGWVFVKQFKPRVVGTQATVRFVPPKIGRYSIQGRFYGSKGASPSSSSTAILIVAPPPG